MSSIDETTLGKLNIRQEYQNYDTVKPEFVIDFKETSNKMQKRNADIPIDYPDTMKAYPCRRNTHTWDYTGVHKVAPHTKKCSGIDSSLNKRHPLLYFHPSNFFMTHGNH